MIILQHVYYAHPNKGAIFEDLNLTVGNQEKIAVTGNNGSGKSTLLKIIAGELTLSSGFLKTDSIPWFVPQIFGQYNDLTIAEALQVSQKLNALKEILDGNPGEKNLAILNDDWTIEERCRKALLFWKIGDVDMQQKISILSGGQKTKVFLAGIAIHQPQIVLMDEPGNHLDSEGKQMLYEFIQTSKATLVVVSHDRKLLNLAEKVVALTKGGLSIYGGNYDFYKEQKTIEADALSQDLKNKEKELRKAKVTARETAERQQKLEARGKKKQEKAGLPTISMNTFRNNAEKTSSRLKDAHTEKLTGISNELNALRKESPDASAIKFGFDNSFLHRGKVLFKATDLNYGYNDDLLWKEPLNFQVLSGERITLKGKNGSGKTTLINIIRGNTEPISGNVYRAESRSVYIDQEYSLIDNAITVYEQAQRFNAFVLQEHEVKIRLNRFLFSAADWDKPCKALSGGEKMRLVICCITIGSKAPDIIMLDEPTNNLDIQNIEILTAALNEYEGTIFVVSHDEIFLKEIHVDREIFL